VRHPPHKKAIEICSRRRLPHGLGSAAEVEHIGGSFTELLRCALQEYCVSWILSRIFAECLSLRLSYCRYLTKRVRCTLPN
jgi:hypothetical protein